MSASVLFLQSSSVYCGLFVYSRLLFDIRLLIYNCLLVNIHLIQHITHFFYIHLLFYSRYLLYSRLFLSNLLSVYNSLLFKVVFFFLLMTTLCFWNKVVFQCIAFCNLQYVFSLQTIIQSIRSLTGKQSFNAQHPSISQQYFSIKSFFTYNPPLV